MRAPSLIIGPAIYDGVNPQVLELTQINVITLDAFLNEHGVGAVDLLKIDVEGFEPFALKGAGRALSSGRVGAVLCEFNAFWLGRAGSGVAELYDLLTRYGLKPVTRFDASASLQNTLFTR